MSVGHIVNKIFSPRCCRSVKQNLIGSGPEITPARQLNSTKQKKERNKQTNKNQQVRTHPSAHQTLSCEMVERLSRKMSSFRFCGFWFGLANLYHVLIQKSFSIFASSLLFDWLFIYYFLIDFLYILYSVVEITYLRCVTETIIFSSWVNLFQLRPAFSPRCRFVTGSCSSVLRYFRYNLFLRELHSALLYSQTLLTALLHYSRTLVTALL